MIEKVNPSHPDKVADRIAGALVDYAYKLEENPKCAFEVLIGHGHCFITGECSVDIDEDKIAEIVERISEQKTKIFFNIVKQDEHLAENQIGKMRCGDNGIFKGVPLTKEEKKLGEIARQIYDITSTDGKYILNDDELTICQSHINNISIYDKMFPEYDIIANPLGYWTGGINVDSGATNRKLGSDMAQSVTGGGLHGKDLSKADVSVNIYAFLKAQKTKKPVELCCAIGDTEIDGKSYEEIVDIARKYIQDVGGFEKFAEWGLF